MPPFVSTWIKRLVHQDDFNEFIAQTGDLQGVPWLDAAVKRLDLHLHIEGLDNLPKDTEGHRFTFVSNHPLGGPDGIVLGKILGERYNGHIRYLVNDLLMNLHGLAPLCVPINKTGSQHRETPKLVDAAFAGDNHIIMFPAGICSRRKGKVIRDLPWSKTFITKSIQTQRDVVPIHFGGHNSDRFYRWANIGKYFGPTFNIVMIILLADETFRLEHATLPIHIGKPISWRTFDRSRKPAEWAEWVRQKVYDLDLPAN